MDAALIVVAADEGPMPQTHEHLAVLQFMGVSRAVVALTKCDLVDPEWLDLVEEEVRDMMAGTGLGEVSIVPTSVETGEGIDSLRRALSDLALSAIVAGFVGRPLLTIEKSLQTIGARLATRLQENIVGIRTVQGFENEEFELAKMDEDNRELFSTELKEGKIESLLEPLADVLSLPEAEVKWRRHAAAQPWLAGTLRESLCSLLDVDALAEHFRARCGARDEPEAAFTQP